MTHSALHEKKKKKNLAVLAAIVIFMAIIFCVTIIRLKAGTQADMAPVETTAPAAEAVVEDAPEASAEEKAEAEAKDETETEAGIEQIGTDPIEAP